MFSLLASLGLLTRWLPGAAQPLGPAEIAHQRVTLMAYIDALIPRDVAPGAIDLDVHTRLFDKADDDARYAHMLGFGARWLDAEAQKHHERPFIDLTGTEKDAVVETAALAARQTPHHGFFRATRADVFDWYWSHAESWPAIGFNGPPQPRGFPDFECGPGGQG